LLNLADLRILSMAKRWNYVTATIKRVIVDLSGEIIQDSVKLK